MLTPRQTKARREDYSFPAKTPTSMHELINTVLGNAHSKCGPVKMQALLLELKHFSLFRKSSEVIQMRLQDRAGYADLHFIGKPVT